MKVFLPIGTLLLALTVGGCNGFTPASDESNNANKTSENDTFEGSEQNFSPEELDEANDPNSEFGQDDELSADTYVEDMLSRDSESASSAGLFLQEPSANGGEEPSEDDPVSLPDSEVSSDEEEDDSEQSVEYDLAESIRDFMVEKIMSSLDSEDETSQGVLTKLEFVDGVLFPNIRELMSEESIARLKAWRTQVFEGASGDDDLLDEVEIDKMLTEHKSRVIALRKILGNHKKRMALKWREVRLSFDKDGDGKLSKGELYSLRKARRDLFKKRRAKVFGFKLGMCLAIHNGKYNGAFGDRLKAHWGKSRERFKDKLQDFPMDDQQSANLTQTTNNPDGSGTTEPVESDDSHSDEDLAESIEEEKDFAHEILSKFPPICHAIVHTAFAYGVAKDLNSYVDEKNLGQEEGAFNCVQEPCPSE